MAEENSNPTTAGRPLIFGEVLFDHFADGGRVLGGAPFNVAWHLQGFGLSPLFVSRLGNDPEGREILDRMTAWGMDTQGIQFDAAHPTGTVNVTLSGGQPRFAICPDQAFDFIDQAPLIDLVARENIALLYHGSLAARNPATRQTLHWLRENYPIPSFVDINLRPPWWTQTEVQWAMRHARWAKLNNDELMQISGDTHVQPANAFAHTVFDAYGLDLLIVTLGEEGALILDTTHELHRRPQQMVEIVDTVGAGDAFSAITLLGLLHEWPTNMILERAIDFSAAICGQRGATAADKGFYGTFMRRWEMK